jgi:hypothetical protein
VLALGLCLVGPSLTAQAAEVTRVATSFEDDNVFDVHFGVAYDYNFKQAAILREWNSGRGGANPDTENRLVKDLIYRQQRHTLTPTVEMGLWHDLALYISLPVVLHDTREYSFDQRVDDCVFGDSPATATCVNKDNSTTIRDEILPRNGFDGTNTTDPFGQFTGPNTELIFRGPVRRGLDQLHVGLKYGILNQTKRSHMPNWIIAAEGRFAVGRPMTFRRSIEIADPDGNHRVGRRIHELGFWTALSRRYRFLDPFFTAFWRQSISASNSLFRDHGGAQDLVNPQSQAGLSVGSEIVPWERKARNLKVAVQVSGSATLHYGGRGYSEIWELLADSPSMVGSNQPESQRLNAAGDPVAPNDFCSRTGALQTGRDMPGSPTYTSSNGNACRPFEGVTDLQDYASFGFNGGLNFHLGKYARLMFGVNVLTDTRHFITFAGRGDANRSGSGGTDPDTVEPGTTEVNPVRRDVVDNVGRRYLVDDVVDLHTYLQFLLTF